METLLSPTDGAPSFFDAMTSRQKGRLLFAQGLSVSEIATYLSEKRSTVESWKQRDGWEKADIFDDVTLGLRARFLTLIFKENKSNANYKEMDFLMRMLERSAKIERYRSGEGNEVDLNPKLANRNKDAKSRKKKLKNQIAQEQFEILENTFKEIFFDFQHEWGDTIEKSEAEIFMMLKSRQIGATFYFALWALIDLLKTGKNKIFLSASKAQAFQFIEYIRAFVLETIELELTGDPIVINGPQGQATIYYLGTNALTAQGRHGDVVIDEFFWIRKFATFQKVAGAMASQKMYKEIYISTPSSILHEAYAFWAGTDGNRKNRVEIDVSHSALKRPQVCPDGKIRQIVTLTDAENAGYDRFNREALKRRYPDDEFQNLFGCQFIDDTGSYFPMSIVETNMVDSWNVWKDFYPFQPKPYEGEVWLGYDPSFTGDNAALAVIAPPKTSLSPYRILEIHQFKGLKASEQAMKIQKICKRYNVVFIGIDNTGNGISVAEHVSNFFPSLKRLNYNPEVKIRMGLRAKELLERRRLQFDAGKLVIAKSFLSIKKALTSGQGIKTLVTTRSSETGHGDIAWAIMNGLEKAPIIDITDVNISKAKKTRIKVYQS
ncbi:terminase large subunit domain-containing protein [Acinetobacter venetianus]|uniref:terminase large subunit domain-containing protein n=1 Tax=Acinetobacter venetianus TaxID=52133 RepID=UPI00215040BF|nr:terminase family protein [Acinetobacter venetianus]MCR4529827.1 terminase family protein [Acinetobacter venetianus]